MAHTLCPCDKKGREAGWAKKGKKEGREGEQKGGKEEESKEKKEGGRKEKMRRAHRWKEIRLLTNLQKVVLKILFLIIYSLI